MTLIYLIFILSLFFLFILIYKRGIKKKKKIQLEKSNTNDKIESPVISNTIDKQITSLSDEKYVLKIIDLEKNISESYIEIDTHTFGLRRVDFDKKNVTLPKDNWKNNWIDFENLILENRIQKLYHFTDFSNWDLIKKYGGLYSWLYCQNNSIQIPMPGGNDLSRCLDVRYQIQDYVRLSLTKNHPMMYIAIKEGRITRPIILEIDVEIIYWQGTMFSNMNATKNGHSIGVSLDDFKRIQFDIVKSRNQFAVEENMRTYYQAEVLVKRHIPIEFMKILGVK